MEELLRLLAVVAAVSVVGLALRLRRHVVVHEGQIGILYRNGTFQRDLPAGRHGWWEIGAHYHTETFEAAPTALLATEQAVLSRDQFSFRVGFTVVGRVVNPRDYLTGRGGPGNPGYFPGSLHPLLGANFSAAVVELFARRTLDEIIAEPRAGLDGIAATLTAAVPGIAIDDILVTSVTMPPEVRKMFTEVERSRREALAALERARGESASLRALANAARSLQANPQLAQLRLLHAMETAKGAKTFVLGPVPAGDAAGVTPAD